MGHEVQIEYSKGYVFLDQSQAYLLPMNTFMLMLHEMMENEEPSTVRSILRSSVESDAIILQKNAQPLKILSKKIDYILSFINTLGYGELIFKHRIKDKFIFCQEKKFFSTLYQKVFGEEPPVLLEELFVGYLETFF